MSTSRQYFVLGGVRSGKSAFAETLTLGLTDTRVFSCLYIATCQPRDDEMQMRVMRHQNRRGHHWDTLEVPIELPSALLEYNHCDKPILVDCLTLWLSNLMMAGQDIGLAGDRLVKVLPQLAGSVVFVSNEVGQGIIPDNKMAREFNDYAGLLHQKIAEAVDEVYFVIAGLSSKLKG